MAACTLRRRCAFDLLPNELVAQLGGGLEDTRLRQGSAPIVTATPANEEPFQLAIGFREADEPFLDVVVHVNATIEKHMLTAFDLDFDRWLDGEHGDQL